MLLKEFEKGTDKRWYLILKGFGSDGFEMITKNGYVGGKVITEQISNQNRHYAREGGMHEIEGFVNYWSKGQTARYWFVQPQARSFDCNTIDVGTI